MTTRSVVPLSASEIWAAQRRFYEHVGVEAWRDIPFFVTSHRLAALAHARVVLALARDLSRQQAWQAGAPLTVLELGAGTGRFAFHFLDCLAELMAGLGLGEFPVTYVMADCSPDTVSFWEHHPGFAGALASGCLRLALHDASEPSGLRLLDPGTGAAVDLQPRSGPLVVIANYVLDSLPQDVFAVDGAGLHAGAVDPGEPVVPDAANAAVEVPAVLASFQFVPAASPFYGDAFLDATLADCAADRGLGFFPFPLQALRWFRHLAGAGPAGALVLATDKAYGAQAEIPVGAAPDIAFHGEVFSMMVNLHALALGSARLGGSAAVRPNGVNLQTGAFFLGSDAARYPEVTTALADAFDRPGPGAIYALYEHALAAPGRTLDLMVAVLRAMEWDPEVFDHFAADLLAKLGEGPRVAVADLRGHLEAVAGRIYPLPGGAPGGANTLFNVGRVFEDLQDHERAAACFQRALEVFGPGEEVLFHLGLCCIARQEYEAALGHLRAVVELRPDHVLARGWIDLVLERRS